MKKFIIALAVVGLVATSGIIIYLNRQKTVSPISAPVVESSPAQTESTPPERVIVPKTEPTVIAEKTIQSAETKAVLPVEETKADEATNSIHKLVDALLSAKNGELKHALFQQLLKDGQLDQAIADLKQRGVENPNDANLPTTLGEAQINKLRAIRDSGGDLNDIGILAMQADKSFNAALKIDPQNWEAQFVKAASMYYWPADATRDNDVVQRLSNLIDQQDTMASQPNFAQPYVVLGNQYQKIGQPEKATATWQLGLTKFPNDSALQKKISGLSNP